ELDEPLGDQVDEGLAEVARLRADVEAKLPPHEEAQEVRALDRAVPGRWLGFAQRERRGEAKGLRITGAHLADGRAGRGAMGPDAVHERLSREPQLASAFRLGEQHAVDRLDGPAQKLPALDGPPEH